MVDGKNLKKVRGYKIPKYRRNIGIVFQDFRLLEKKTVFDNIAFAMEITGASRAMIRRQVETALSLVGLSHKANEFPAHLSGGEQQRVAVARALVNAPQIIIADEPTDVYKRQDDSLHDFCSSDRRPDRKRVHRSG